MPAAYRVEFALGGPPSSFGGAALHGLVTSNTMGGPIHVLLMVAITVVPRRVIQGSKDLLTVKSSARDRTDGKCREVKGKEGRSMRSRIPHRVLVPIIVVFLAACSPAESADNPDNSPMEDPTPVTPAAPASYTLDAGTLIDGVTTATISSREARAGDVFTALVVTDVRDGDGTVVIPAGSTLHGSITEVSPASSDRSTGMLTLAVSSVTVGSGTYDLDVSIDSLGTISDRRGIEKADVARVTGGAAAGAILGKVIGGSNEGTIIGAVAGAATGAAVSALVKDVDIVLPEGAHLMLTMRRDLTVMAGGG